MKFDFTSQICTTKEQSERLLALGLKRDTADMGIVKSTNEIYVGCPTDYSFERGLHIPAWSLHRLIELCLNNKTPWIQVKLHNTYDEIISLIEELIRRKGFNNEYLEE